MVVSLLEHIGEGGFGDIWRGIDNLDRPVAVKIIRAESIGMADALTHAKALARAHHRNVVTVFGVERVVDPKTNQDCDCVVMEFLEGETLAKRLTQTAPLSNSEAERIIGGMIDGLAHIHAQDLVHGDLHDLNVMVTSDDIKIIDILYRESWALLSSASQDFKVRRDVADLREMIVGVLDHSEYGHTRSLKFLQNLSVRPTIADIREVLHQIIGNSVTTETVASESIVEHPFVDSAVYFYNERFTRAFPGIRGIAHFSDPAQINDRLDILLRNPLGFREPGKRDGSGGVQYPIWWWRGLGDLQIEHYERLSENEILINRTEWRIRKASAHNSPIYYQCFVYLEFAPMEQTGLYQYAEGEIGEWTQRLGGVQEEYGLFAGRKITRAEYDDGAAVIDGKVVDISGRAKARMRYITPYNLVIASQKSPVNNIQFDRDFDAIMRRILYGASTVEELAAAICSLPKKTLHGE